MTDDQEAKDAAKSVERLMTQRGVDAREWQAQSKQWEEQCKQHRATIAALQDALHNHVLCARRAAYRWKRTAKAWRREALQASATLAVVVEGQEQVSGLMPAAAEPCLTRIETVKQAANDACQSVYEEWRNGATFENMPLAIASRMALAWMDLEAL